MRLTSTERLASANLIGQGIPVRQVRLQVGATLGRQRRMRHDLSPIKTSQISLVRLCDKTVGDNQVIAAIVVQVDELRTPSPASHGNSGIDANIAKTPVPRIQEKRIVHAAGGSYDLARQNWAETAVEM